MGQVVKEQFFWHRLQRLLSTYERHYLDEILNECEFPDYILRQVRLTRGTKDELRRAVQALIEQYHKGQVLAQGVQAIEQQLVYVGGIEGQAGHPSIIYSAGLTRFSNYELVGATSGRISPIVKILRELVHQIASGQMNGSITASLRNALTAVDARTFRLVSVPTSDVDPEFQETLKLTGISLDRNHRILFLELPDQEGRYPRQAGYDDRRRGQVIDHHNFF